MNITELLKTPGEHSFLIKVEAGDVEGVLCVPEGIQKNHVAVLGHPHSLKGGTMNNKVVTTMVRAFKALHIPSIRFNFRGVGKSSGSYDEGLGESQDMLVIAKRYQDAVPQARFIFAGFSFGSYVAYKAARQFRHELLITIAPPVHHYDYRLADGKSPAPWVILQGDSDEVVPEQIVLDFAASFEPPLPVLRFEDTGHFFHGKLTELKSRLISAVQEQVPSV